MNWGLENTFDFCFNGIEKGSIVAVSTYMYHEHGNHSDHIIDWSNGYPTWILLANYPDGNAPEFKHYERTDKMHYFANSAELQFESISDFKWCMRCGGEVEFTWNDKSYGIGHEQDGKIVFYEANNAASEIFCNSSDEILNIMLGKFRLREIITEINVIARSI